MTYTFQVEKPLRLPCFISPGIHNTRARVLSAVSIALVAVTAILPLCQGEYSLEKIYIRSNPLAPGERGMTQ